MGVIASVIAGIIEIAGLFMVGHAWYRSVSSGQAIYANSLQSGAGPIRSFDLDLDPSMSPVGFVFSATVHQMYMHSSAARQRYNYWASLTLERKQVWQKSVTFSLDREDDRKRQMPQWVANAAPENFTVPDAGRYRFAMAAQGGSDHRVIQNIEVEARRNVAGVDMKKVWWGLGLIVAGGLLQMLFGVPLPGKQND